MSVTVQYETMLKRAAGVRSEVIELDGLRDVRDVVQRVAERRGEPVRSLLIDASGALRKSALIFVGDRQICAGDGQKLQDGDVITLMSPISGG